MDTTRLTTYTRVGNAFLDKYYLEDVGSIENLKTRVEKIEEAFWGRTSPCLDGTPAPKGLNIRVSFNSFSAGRTFVSPKDITDFMNAYNVKKPSKLIGKGVKIYHYCTQLVGLEPLAQE